MLIGAQIADGICGSDAAFAVLVSIHRQINGTHMLYMSPEAQAPIHIFAQKSFLEIQLMLLKQFAANQLETGTHIERLCANQLVKHLYSRVTTKVVTIVSLAHRLSSRIDIHTLEEQQIWLIFCYRMHHLLYSVLE